MGSTLWLLTRAIQERVLWPVDIVGNADGHGGVWENVDTIHCLRICAGRGGQGLGFVHGHDTKNAKALGSVRQDELCHTLFAIVVDRDGLGNRAAGLVHGASGVDCAGHVEGAGCEPVGLGEERCCEESKKQKCSHI